MTERINEEHLKLVDLVLRIDDIDAKIVPALQKWRRVEVIDPKERARRETLSLEIEKSIDAIRRTIEAGFIDPKFSMEKLEENTEFRAEEEKIMTLLDEIGITKKETASKLANLGTFGLQESADESIDFRTLEAGYALLEKEVIDLDNLPLMARKKPGPKDPKYLGRDEVKKILIQQGHIELKDLLSFDWSKFLRALELAHARAEITEEKLQEIAEKIQILIDKIINDIQSNIEGQEYLKRNSQNRDSILERITKEDTDCKITFTLLKFLNDKIKLLYPKGKISFHIEEELIDEKAKKEVKALRKLRNANQNYLDLVRPHRDKYKFYERAGFREPEGRECRYLRNAGPNAYEVTSSFEWEGNHYSIKIDISADHKRKFKGWFLCGGELQDINLNECDFTNADFAGATLGSPHHRRYADIDHTAISFKGAKLHGANFKDTKRTNVIFDPGAEQTFFA